MISCNSFRARVSRSPSGSAASSGARTPPTITRSRAFPSGARFGKTLESHNAPRIFRFSPRGMRKPNPSRGLPIVAFPYPSAATVIGE